MKQIKRKNENFWQVFLACEFILVLGIFAFNIYIFGQVKALQNFQASPQAIPMMGQPMSRMSFSEFDKQKAVGFMDANGDGACDSCGMPIDQCIASGMMQCSMDSSSTIGALGSQHIHADWKIYINGNVLDLTSYSHMQRMQEDKAVSSFIHVDSGAPAPEKTGDLLHMHATGVPLSMFFESLDMSFDERCMTISKTEMYCDDEKNTLKFYVNGKPNNKYGDYVFIDLDKILISYGNENQEQIQQQLSTITDFARVH